MGLQAICVVLLVLIRLIYTTVLSCEISDRSEAISHVWAGLQAQTETAGLPPLCSIILW